jgi:hypothetical protein
VMVLLRGLGLRSGAHAESEGHADGSAAEQR